MSVALAVALGALGLLLASWLHYAYWSRHYGYPLEYEVVAKVPTEDGSAIELRRLPMPIDGQRSGPPILLVHGLALNHRNLDMLEDLSLGRHLTSHGRDVWLLTLRCARHDLRWSEELAATFENMARYDLPLAVKEVQRRTGVAEIDYVGFSMGGMLMYAGLDRFVPCDALRKVVIIGSPSRVAAPFAMLAMIARFVPRWLVPTLRLRIASNFAASVAEWLKTPIHHWVCNPNNLSRGVTGYSLVNGFVNIPGRLAAEFVRWAADGGEVRYDSVNVLESLRRVSSPVLFVAGAIDRLAPESSVRAAYDAWGADRSDEVHKEYRVASLEAGAAADYGHGDLMIGRFAAEDVFEPVAAFLAPTED